MFKDTFESESYRWVDELEAGGKVNRDNGICDIDVPGGCTIWLDLKLDSPIRIKYQAMVIKMGGANDRSSDLNCFWMATDVRAPSDITAPRRTGRFKDYDYLRCYYVGLGVHNNTFTRFRRYTGRVGDRPLLDEHNLNRPEYLIIPNIWVNIDLIANGPVIQYHVDQRIWFDYWDPRPYTTGWFAFRTVFSHIHIREFSVNRIA